MPVRVDVPVRLRVDPGALLEREDGVAAALYAAAGRALAASREVVVKPRGGYVGVRIHPPEVRWSGAGAPQVGAATRARVEARIAAVLADAAREAGVEEVARAAERALRPLAAPAAERPDPARLWRMLGAYALPAYDGGGEHTAVPVQSPADEEPIRLPFAWFRSGNDATAERLMREAMEDDEIDFPTSGFVGVVFAGPQGVPWLIVWNVDTGQRVLGAELGGLVQPQIRVVDGVTRVVQVPVALRADADFHVGNVRPLASLEQRTRLVRERWEADLWRMVSASDQAAGYVSIEEREAFRRNAVEAEITRLTSAIGESFASSFELTSDGVSFLIPTPHALPENLSVDVVSAWEPIPEDVRERLRQRIRERRAAGRANPAADAGDGTGAGTGTAAGDGTGAGAGAGDGTGPGAGTDSGTGTGMGAGTGAGTGTGTGTGAAPGTGTGTGGAPGGTPGAAGGERGGFVHTGEAPAPGARRYFPVASGGRTVTLVCESFLHEPSVNDLGDDGRRLRGMMDEIAFRLQIPTCEFAGQFCVNAARAMAGRATTVSAAAAHETALTRPVGNTNQGNLGSLHFTPVASPAIQLLRHLAGVTPLLGALASEVTRVYDAHSDRIGGTYRGSGAGWALHLYMEFTPAMKRAVAGVFVGACRALMLQLLRASRDAIQARLDNFPSYSLLFEQMVVTQLASVDELLTLRDRLQRGNDGDAAAGDPRHAEHVVPLAPPAEWRESTRQLTRAVGGEGAPPPGGARPGIVDDGTGPARIRDDHGVEWTMRALESAIAVRRGLAEDVDPLVKQITGLPGMMARVRADRGAIRTELRRVLDEMADSNREITREVEGSGVYAFRAGRIHSSLASRTVPGTSYALGGIHMQAHQEVGEFFGGSPFYAAGIDHLFGAEEGRATMLGLMEFTGIILISILCPPAGVAVGIAAAAVHYSGALERQQLREALIDPELVITHAEVEAELFAARLGVALSFLPEAGTLLRGVRLGVRATARVGVVGGARIVGRATARGITRQTAEAIGRAGASAFAREVVTGEVLNRVLGAAIEPLLLQIQREARVTGPTGGSAGASDVVAMLAAEGAAP